MARRLGGWSGGRACGVFSCSAFPASLGAGRESLRWALVLLAPAGFWAAWHLWTSGATVREDELRAT
jgi:hypothetical protein